jgi:hypothetical protein
MTTIRGRERLSDDLVVEATAAIAEATTTYRDLVGQGMGTKAVEKSRILTRAA